MNKYESPDMKVIYFEVEDVIATSGPGEITDPGDLDFD